MFDTTMDKLKQYFIYKLGFSISFEIRSNSNFKRSQSNPRCWGACSTGELTFSNLIITIG